jgi:membrane dipeptidase
LSVTLLHMTDSALGQTSSPVRRGTAAGLGHKGRDYIAALNARRVFVDLAHIGRVAFFEAVDVHDKGQPLIVTHTGVNGVHRSWRNLDDEQLRAVADTGGVIGIVYHGEYLCGRYWSGGTTKDVVAHLAHVIDTVGEDHAALGSDWDGLIVTPKDMRTCLELPVLVQRMLDHGFGERVIRKVLGENFLRSLAQLRPGR